MAGQSVVWRMSADDKDNMLAQFPGSVWTGLAHAAGVANAGGGVFPGWTAVSRAQLARARDGCGGLADRNLLPPHRYITIQAGAPTAAQLAFLRTCYWTNDLIRPSDPNFGVIGLCAAAQAAWNLNKKVEALAAQLTHGATSIEIYYLGKKEMV